MIIDINDIVKKNINNFNDDNPIFRIVAYIGMLMTFCWYVFIIGLVMFIVLPSGPVAWEFFGAAGLAFVIFFGTMRFLMSLIPQDVVDDMYDELKKQLENNNDENNNYTKENKDNTNDDAKKRLCNNE